MYMIGHRDIGVQFALCLTKRLVQPVQVATVVFLSKKTRLTVVPALHDMQRYGIKVDVGATKHKSMLARKYIEPVSFYWR